MRIRLAILDNDREYLDRLSGFLSARYAERLEVYAFTDASAALACLINSRIDVFLAGEAHEIRADDVPERCGFGRLTATPGAVGDDGRARVCKYQRAETIYRKVLEIFDSCARYAGVGADSGGRCEIILFTSASGGTGCSTSAAACAVRLARSGKPALYLNLEPLGDSGAFFSGEGRTDFSDIIFALKSSAANLPVKLEIGARRDASGVFFFAPPRTALDISELDGGDIDALAARLRESGMFEYVVADAPLAPGRLAAHVMRHAQKVVFVSDGSDMCERKMAAARRVLEIIEGREEGARVPPVYVLYNKLTGRTGVRSVWDGARVLGGVPRCEGADTARVVRLLSESDVFDELTGAGVPAPGLADGWGPGRR